MQKAKADPSPRLPQSHLHAFGAPTARVLRMTSADLRSCLRRRRVCQDGESPAGGVDLENFAGDDHALNLAGAFADGAELDVPVELLHRVVLDEAIAAVDLHRLVRHPAGRLFGEPRQAMAG